MGSEPGHDDLEHEAGVVFEVAPELGRELRVRDRRARGFEQIEPAPKGVERARDIDLVGTHEVRQPAHRLARRPLDARVVLEQRDLLGAERALARIGSLCHQPFGDLAQRPRADEFDAGGFQVCFDERRCVLRTGAIEPRDQLRRQAAHLQHLGRRQAGQLGAVGFRPPEVVAQASPPSLRHVERVEQRREEAEVANPELEVVQACLAQCRDDEPRHGGIVLLAVRGGEGFDPCLAELAAVRAGVAAGLIAEGGAVVAVARRHVASGIARQMQPASRHREVGAQAQLFAVGVGENVGARSELLADHVEEHARGLDHRGRHQLVAGAREGGHQALRLRLQRLELLCGLR